MGWCGGQLSWMGVIWRVETGGRVCEWGGGLGGVVSRRVRKVGAAGVMAVRARANGGGGWAGGGLGFL